MSATSIRSWSVFVTWRQIWIRFLGKVGENQPQEIQIAQNLCFGVWVQGKDETGGSKLDIIANQLRKYWNFINICMNSRFTLAKTISMRGILVKLIWQSPGQRIRIVVHPLRSRKCVESGCDLGLIWVGTNFSCSENQFSSYNGSNCVKKDLYSHLGSVYLDSWLSWVSSSMVT